MAQGEQAKKVVGVLLVGSDRVDQCVVEPLEVRLVLRIPREIHRLEFLSWAKNKN